MRVLIIEDNDDKYDKVAEIASESLPDASFERACDLYEAELQIENESWALLLLDMTLDLRRGGTQRTGAAQDYTGGLKIIGQMYYDDIPVPTIIITGFDSFPTSKNGGDGVVLGLEAVESQARARLGDLLIGLVRHGPETWEGELRELLFQFRDLAR